MNENDINNYIPSLLNPRTFKKDRGLSLTQNSIVSRSSLSLRKNNGLSTLRKSRNIHGTRFCSVLMGLLTDKENSQNVNNFATKILKTPNPKKESKNSENEIEGSVDFSAIQDLETVKNYSKGLESICLEPEVQLIELDENNIQDKNESLTLISLSSATDLNDCVNFDCDTTLQYEVDRPVVSVSLGINNCNQIELSTTKDSLKRVYLSTENKQTTIDCEIIECSQPSTDSYLDENMNKASLPIPPKNSAIAVNLEIKRKKMSDNKPENSKVLILNTDAIEKLSHVIVQPPNYKIVKRQNFDRNKFRNDIKKNSIVSPFKNGKASDGLKQRSIEEYFSGKTKVSNSAKVFDVNTIFKNLDGVLDRYGGQGMSNNTGVAEVARYDRVGRGSCRSRKDHDSPKSGKPLSRRSCESPRYQEIKISNSEAPRSPRSKNESLSSHSPRKNVDSIHFNLPTKSKSTKTSCVTRIIPHHKIVAGTHFAVDAFSYGEIPNVKHYFLTHFHSDHYSGLKKGFNKLLFCSKITADLCVSRLGVNPKCIHIINPDETLFVEGVEITAVDANHCPGALMLVFTLPNGKNLLHTGDFRASPFMESYPILWNKDIHTVYLDTTYCNPRYDFPTQDQSIEMALFLLRQKKLLLEKAGKKFSSVLIVCGTYTIGKEKFFLGMARRFGCSVWACPEKDRVLQAVEGRSFSHAPPQSCQLHVVPMKDLTHEKLRSYLESLQGAFSEVVAFKPSGWENGKNSSVEKDMVTIHGIPYSEHSSFSELIRFVKFLKPKQVVPTVDIAGGIKAVQKYFPCPLVYKEDIQCQSKVTDFFSIQDRQQGTAVT